MDEAARGWFLFWGWVFVLLGVRLFLDSEEKARAAAEWDTFSDPAAGASEPRPPRALVGAYRLVGLAFGLFGAGLAGSILAGLGFAPRIFGSGPSGPSARLAVGALLLAAGGSLAVLKILRARRILSARLVEAVTGQGPGEETWARKASGGCLWLLAGSLAAYGLALIRDY